MVMVENSGAPRKTSKVGLLESLVKYAVFIRVFAAAISKDGEAYSLVSSVDENTLKPVDLNDDLKRLQKTSADPLDGKRANWERNFMQTLNEKDRKELTGTLLNLDPKNGAFDEYLYTIHARKLTHLSLEENKRLLFIKLKETVIGLKIKPSENPALFDLRVYLMLTKKGKLYSPIITVCAILTPNQSLEPDIKIETFVKTTPILEPDFTFDLNKQVPEDSETIKKIAKKIPDRCDLDTISLSLVKEYFIDRLNSQNGTATQNEKEHEFNPRYVQKSGALMSHLLVVPFSKVTADPLAALKSFQNTNLETVETATYILRLLGLGPLGTSTGMLALPREVIIERTADVKSTYAKDYIAYHLPQRIVELLSYEESKASTEMSRQTATPVHDFEKEGRSYLYAIGWDALLYSLINSQKLLFSLYSQSLSSVSTAKQSKIKKLKTVTTEAIEDFEEYFDVDVTRDNPYFKKEYEILKQQNFVDEYYNTLLKKRDLINSQVTEELMTQQNRIFVVAVASLIVSASLQLAALILQLEHII
jgi:hypothetical protein